MVIGETERLIVRDYIQGESACGRNDTTGGQMKGRLDYAVNRGEWRQKNG